jgi:predicted NUDIX family phosphoesterase
MACTEVEQILVAPTAVFHRLGHFQGFSRDVDRYLSELLRPENLSFRPRDQMEHDPSFKQLIPYVIFRHCAGGEVHLFAYTRGLGQGEQRLHRKRSIGIGGHISLADADGENDWYAEGMRRELDEEVAIESAYQARCIGLINDDQTEVGRVHLGVVHVFDLERPVVSPREPDIAESGFRPLATLLGERDQFETWSQICLDELASWTD